MTAFTKSKTTIGSVNPAPDEKEVESLLYGADAKQWLERWDNNEVVWSVEMGGIGPGYEQCIQIAAAEIVRWLLENNIDSGAWEESNGENWKKDKEALHDAVLSNPIIKELGLSGAQYAAAVSVGTSIYKMGPVELMELEFAKDRRIQVTKTFPTVQEPQS